MRRYEMLPNIVRHSVLVRDIALLIARKLNNSGHQLDLALVEAGALLHDIAKTMCINSEENHASAGGKLLANLGYPAVAEIICQHICLNPGTFDQETVTEAEVVNYADKRVKHVEVVNIEERFRDVLDRYAERLRNSRDRFEKVQLETRLLEEKIFSMIDISPEQVFDSLSKAEGNLHDFINEQFFL